jgi:hypothetical protein
MRFPVGAGLSAYLCLCLHVLGPAANGQFKQIGPAPFSPSVAHQRIRTLLDQVEPANRQQTIDKVVSLTPWFRNVLDEELISGWQREGRERLTLVMEPLANPRVAAAVVEFSWRKRTDATLNQAYAPMLGHLMARYPESGKSFLSDLLGPVPPELSPAQAEAVCRILIDMPDLGTWNESALQILPRYRAIAERLLTGDRHGDDQEKSYRAHRLLAELRGEKPGAINQPPVARSRAVPPSSRDSGGPLLFPPPATASSPNNADGRPEPTPGSRPTRPTPSLPVDSVPSRPVPAPTLNTVSPASPTEVPAPRATPIPAAPKPYNGAMSGTLECNGVLVPQNAEYVFRNLPLLKMQLDYNTKVWEARLAPGENQTQRLILKNKGSGPQKQCAVHWIVVP